MSMQERSCAASWVQQTPNLPCMADLTAPAPKDSARYCIWVAGSRNHMMQDTRSVFLQGPIPVVSQQELCSVVPGDYSMKGPSAVRNLSPIKRFNNRGLLLLRPAALSQWIRLGCFRTSMLVSRLARISSAAVQHSKRVVAYCTYHMESYNLCSAADH